MGPKSSSAYLEGSLVTADARGTTPAVLLLGLPAGCHKLRPRLPCAPGTEVTSFCPAALEVAHPETGAAPTD